MIARIILAMFLVTGCVWGQTKYLKAWLCSVDTLTDSSAGTDGNALTGALLDSSTFGISGANWTVTAAGTQLTFSTTGHKALVNAQRTFCTNSWPGDVGNLGANLLASSTTLRYGKFTMPASTAQTVTAGVWFQTTAANTSVPNMDVFTIFAQNQSPQNYVNVAYQGNGMTLRLSLETPSNGGCTGHSSAADPTNISNNTWYWITARYTGDTSGTITNILRVYDASLTLLTETSVTSCMANTASSTVFGVTSASAVGDATQNLRFDKVKICYKGGCPWPMLP